MNDILVLILLVLCEAALSDRQSEQEALRRIKREDDKLASCEQCGQSFDTAQSVPVIINGTNVASSEKYPWMVGLIQTGTAQIFCGGAIISKNFILTAAHCMMDQMKMKTKSRNSTEKQCAGRRCSIKDFLLENREVTIGFMTPGHYTGVKPQTQAADVMVHPDYFYDDGKAHDIALIKLAHPINCNHHANPICLPPPNIALPPGSLVTISGYGQRDPSTHQAAKELSEAMIQVTDKEGCKNMGFEDKDLDKMYCLKGYQGETPCFGDSGGSMFGKKYGKKYVALGVASLHSSPTCDSKASVIYTSVANHLPWIKEKMGGKQSGGKYYGSGGDSGDDYGSGDDSGDYYGSGDDYGSEEGMKRKNRTKGKKSKGRSSTKKGKKTSTQRTIIMKGCSKKGKSTTGCSGDQKGKNKPICS